jgi:hypothetical protein
MHQASRSSLALPGEPLPASVCTLLRDVGDEPQLVLAGKLLGRRWPSIEFKRLAPTAYPRGMSERIESALRRFAYRLRIAIAGSDGEGC